MAYDALLQLQAAVTRTADLSSTAVDLKTGTPHRGLAVDVRVYDVTGGASLKLQASADNTTFVDVTGARTATAVGVVQFKFATGYRYLRLNADLDGTTSTLAYDANLSLESRVGQKVPL
jgi:hypothetical protein